MHSQWLDELRNIVGQENLLAEAADVESFSHDEMASDRFKRIPEAVVKPSSVGC